MMPILFIYGTLQKGMSNHTLLAHDHAEFVSSGVLCGVEMRIVPNTPLNLKCWIFPSAQGWCGVEGCGATKSPHYVKKLNKTFCAKHCPACNSIRAGLGVPVVVCGESEGDVVKGELWEVSKKALKALDVFNTPAGYVRRTCTVVLPTEEVLEAEVYFWENEEPVIGWERVKDGDYKRYVKEKM